MKKFKDAKSGEYKGKMSAEFAKSKGYVAAEDDESVWVMPDGKRFLRAERPELASSLASKPKSPQMLPDGDGGWETLGESKLKERIAILESAVEKLEKAANSNNGKSDEAAAKS